MFIDGGFDLRELVSATELRMMGVARGNTKPPMLKTARSAVQRFWYGWKM